MTTDTPASGPFADISAFTGDGNAINAATKTALNTALTNILGLFQQGTSYGQGTQMAHPDFALVPTVVVAKMKTEIDALKAAITAHA